MANPGNFGASLYGLDPYGSDFAPFGVAGATSISPTLVQVRFTDIIDLTDSVFANAANYNISPPLTVHAVVIESADSVILETDVQSFETYTVTVTAARSFFGVVMLPPLNTATFTGSAFFPSYFAAGTTPTRVRVVFQSAMQLNAAITNPASYTVTDLNGNVLTIVSVQPEQTGTPFSVVLTLSTPMATTSWYQTVLSSGILDLDGQSLKPLAVDFQFILPLPTTQVPIPEFTGEVQGGPFGNPAGLVFFSPSLNVAASNSVIQVEEVDVCTTAYDQYNFPQPIDPAPFYLWSQTTPQTTLGEPGIVLFAGFPFLSEVKFELGFTGSHLNDQVEQASDGSCSIVMAAQFAPGYVALLNDLAWTLFSSTTTVPPMFICANNGGTIPPGPETTIVLHQAFTGTSSMTVVGPVVQHWALAHIVGSSTLTTVPEVAPLNMQANSIMRVGRPGVRLGASVSMVGSSSLHVAGLPTSQAFSVSVAIDAYAIVRVHAKQKWLVSASMNGFATIFVRANLHRHIAASITASSSMTGSATAGPLAHAAIVGSSSITAQATLHHFASVAISVGSTMTAAAT